MRTKRTLAVLTCASALLLASSASADTVLVKYGLTGTVTVPGGVLASPVGGGMATVEFQGTPGSGIATGPAHLASLTFAQPGVIIIYGGGGFTVAPGAAVVSMGSGGGSLTAFGTGGLSLTGNPGYIAGAFHCTGPCLLAWARRARQPAVPVHWPRHRFPLRNRVGGRRYWDRVHDPRHRAGDSDRGNRGPGPRIPCLDGHPGRRTHPHRDPRAGHAAAAGQRRRSRCRARLEGAAQAELARPRQQL